MTYEEEKQKFDQFVSANSGKQVIVLPSSKKDGYGQCFDLVVAYTDLLGIPHYPNNPSPFPYQNAHDIYDSFGTFQAQYFDRIPNTDTFIPQKGDIGVYSADLNGGAGDVFLCTGVGNLNKFEGFNQNWLPKQPATFIEHSYRYFLGVLRFKTQSLSQRSQQDADYIKQLEDAVNRKDNEIQSYNAQIIALNTQISSLKEKSAVDEVTLLSNKKDIEDRDKEIVDLEQTVTELKSSNKDLLAENTLLRQNKPPELPIVKNKTIKGVISFLYSLDKGFRQ